MTLLSILLVLPLAAILPALASLAGAGIGAYATSRQNKQNQQAQDDANTRNFQFSWDMYNQQRKDALSDFNMVNEYNSPLQQMQRFKEAGLNPNLVYGKGAETTATQVRSAQGLGAKADPFIKNQMPISNALQSGLNTLGGIIGARNTAAQTDNLYSQRALNDAQTAKVMQETARSKFDYEQAVRMKDFAFDAAKLANQKTMAEIDKLYADRSFTINEDQRKELQNPYNIQKTAADIILTNLQAKQVQLKNAQNDLEREKIQEEINYLIKQQDNVHNDTLMKELEIQWKKKQAEMREDGMNPDSPTWQLQFYEIWKKIFEMQK